MLCGTRDVKADFSGDISSKLYHTEDSSHGLRVCIFRSLVPNTSSIGVSQNQFLS